MPTITTRVTGDMLFESQLGNHRVTVDVPAGMGGNDRAPTPPEFFVASLGSCVTAFVASYCKQAGIDPKDVTVDVDYEKAQDPVRLTDLKVRINVPSEACKRERAFLKVAEQCPVHRTVEMFEGMKIEVVTPEG